MSDTDNTSSSLSPSPPLPLPVTVLSSPSSLNDFVSQCVSSADIPSLLRLHTIFPTSPFLCSQLISVLKSVGKSLFLSNFFSSHLLKCFDVDIWLSYSQFTKEQNPNDFDAITQTFEFSLRHLQYDFNIHKIHKEYIAHIKSKPCETQYDEQVRNSTLRRLYSRFVIQPSGGVEELWREYDQFEHSISNTLAKGLLGELNQKVLLAKQVAKERKKKRAKINFTFWAQPAESITSRNGNENYLNIPLLSSHVQSLSHWSSLLEYEKSNPLRCPPSEFLHRVTYAYRQCLMFCRFYPQIWGDFAHFLEEFHSSHPQIQSNNNSNNNNNNAFNDSNDSNGNGSSPSVMTPSDFSNAIWKECSQVFIPVPSSGPFNYFLWSDYEESHQRFQSAKSVMEDANTTWHQRATDVTLTPLESDRILYQLGIPLIFINNQRIIRRIDGADAARKVFVLSRKSPFCRSINYSFAAEMEFKVNNSPQLSAKILSVGITAFPMSKEIKIHQMRLYEKTNDHQNYRGAVEEEIKMREKEKESEGKSQPAHSESSSSSLWDSSMSPSLILSSYTQNPTVDPFRVSDSPLPQFTLDDPFVSPLPSPSLFTLWSEMVKMERWLSTDLKQIKSVEIKMANATANSTDNTNDNGNNGVPTPVMFSSERFRYSSLWPNHEAWRIVTHYQWKYGETFNAQQHHNAYKQQGNQISQQQQLVSWREKERDREREREREREQERERQQTKERERHSSHSFDYDILYFLIRNLPPVEYFNQKFTAPAASSLVAFLAKQKEIPKEEEQNYQRQINWEAVENNVKGMGISRSDNVTVNGSANVSEESENSKKRKL